MKFRQKAICEDDSHIGKPYPVGHYLYVEDRNSRLNETRAVFDSTYTISVYQDIELSSTWYLVAHRIVQAIYDSQAKADMEFEESVKGLGLQRKLADSFIGKRKAGQ